MKEKNSHGVCQICGQSLKMKALVSGSFVRQPIAEVIRQSHPEWSPGGYICHRDLNRFRGEYVFRLLETEKGEISSIDRQVVESMREHETLSMNVHTEFERRMSFGERLSDRIAEFGGSWKFITIFFVVLVSWMCVNTQALLSKPFDPYPFILLNLVLSCLAAIQAPIILMSQNRQELKDRLRAEHDYQVNLKAELEIRLLNEKIDHLMGHQWEKLAEIQQVQIDLLED